jgi:RsiW-degrading membrane proteinase PrsW (M82 family)
MSRLVLVLEDGPERGREHVLESGALTLGRDESSQIRFPHDDTNVSRRHAVLQADAGRFRIVDQQSTNGTWVNQQRVDQAWLNAGDLLQIGENGPRLRVRIDGPAPVPTNGNATVVRPRMIDGTLFDPTRHTPKPRSTGAIVLVLIMMFVGVAAGLLVFLMTTFELGLGVSIVGVLVAFAPLPVYLALWLWLDRYDPEPIWALAGAFLWGAGAATFVSALVNTAFDSAMLKMTGNQGVASFLSASISAPFIEEAGKGLAVLLIFLVLRREFDGVLDGIIYAGVVALGFAAVENVLYYGRSLVKGGAGGLVVIFVLRGVLGPFAHAVFTSMIGIGCGFARLSHSGFVRFIAPVLGYGAAVFLHSTWNVLASLGGSFAGFILIYLVFWVPLFTIFLAIVLWMGVRESALIKRMLRYEVSMGSLTDEQVQIAGSWLRRLSWTLGSIGDFARFRARRKFLAAATRLALSYSHAERAAASGSETVSASLIPVFRKELLALKAQI